MFRKEKMHANTDIHIYSPTHIVYSLAFLYWCKKLYSIIEEVKNKDLEQRRHVPVNNLCV